MHPAKFMCSLLVRLAVQLWAVIMLVLVATAIMHEHLVRLFRAARACSHRAASVAIVAQNVALSRVRAAVLQRVAVAAVAVACIPSTR